MVFNIEGKVALITGGASGIGLEYAKELLRNGAKGVTLADIDPKFGDAALLEISKEFGHNKAIFVRTDVSNDQEFEEAFRKTIDIFKSIDILINNAGILNDAAWKKEVSINVNGVIGGMILGMDKYLPKYKQGEEAVIVNIGSIGGIGVNIHFPVYCASKYAVNGLTKCWGSSYHYERTNVRVVCICPGRTDTPILDDICKKVLGSRYAKNLLENTTGSSLQRPDHVAKEMVKLIKNGPNGTIWIVEGGEPAYEYVFPGIEAFKKNGVTLADIDPGFGEAALLKIREEFGLNKAIFVKTDVSNVQEFEEAFKKTIETFNSIDILINNAAILNDAIWEREVSINVNGVIRGMILGMENYLPKYKQDEEAVIVNVASLGGIEVSPYFPVYCGTKYAVNGMSKCWGQPYHYERTKVRVLSICPGTTDTPIMKDLSKKILGDQYGKDLQSHVTGWVSQEADYVAKEMVKIIKSGPNGTIWIVEGGEPAYEYIFPGRETFKKNCLRA